MEYDLPTGTETCELFGVPPATRNEIQSNLLTYTNARVQDRCTVIAKLLLLKSQSLKTPREGWREHSPVEVTCASQSGTPRLSLTILHRFSDCLTSAPVILTVRQPFLGLHARHIHCFIFPWAQQCALPALLLDIIVIFACLPAPGTVTTAHTFPANCCGYTR